MTETAQFRSQPEVDCLQSWYSKQVSLTANSTVVGWFSSGSDFKPDIPKASLFKKVGNRCRGSAK